MRCTPIFAALTLALAACVNTNAAVLNPEIKRNPVCPNGVALFLSPDRVPTAYEEVALLNSTGETSWTSESGMVNSQRKKAASLGANGIILGNVNEPNAGTKIIGSILGTGSERKGKAVAIWIPADTARVRTACASKSPT